MLQTKAQTVENFKSNYGTKKQFNQALRADRIAVQENWRSYKDGLNKDNVLSDNQVNNWTLPF